MASDCPLYYGQLNIQAGAYSTEVGTSMGNWVAIQSETSSLHLDGSAVTGEHSANREIKLQVTVEASTRPELNLACAALIGEANKQKNTIVWIHDDSNKSIVYDTFRCTGPVRIDDDSDAWLRRTYQLTIPAMPFTREGVRQFPFVTLTNVVIMPTTANLVGVRPLDCSGVNAEAYETSAYSNGIPFYGAVGAGTDAGSTAFGGLAAVSGCTVATSGSSKRITLTSTAAEVVANTRIAVTATVLTVGVGWVDWSGDEGWTFTVGIEWFNGTTSIKVDWGTPKRQDIEGRTPWATFKRPAAATHAKYRLKMTGVNGAQADVAYVQTEHLATSSQNPAGGPAGPFAGGSFNAAPTYPTSGRGGSVNSGYEYFQLAAPVDASGQPALGLWLYRTPSAYMGPTIADGRVTMRLHSADKWSAWYYQPDAAENLAFAEGAWRHPVFDPTTPDQISAGGAANLAAIDAVSFDIIGLHADTAPYRIGPVTAGPPPGETSSDRGTVFVLDSIIGDAPSPAAIQISADTAMDNCIIQIVDPNDGPPLLAVTANVATANAPADYNGVYTMIAARITADPATNPTLTVTQKHAGVAVRTEVYKGTVVPGGRLVRFGAQPLPLVQYPDDNESVSYTFALTPADGHWGDVLPLNVESSMVVCDLISPAAKVVFVEEPDITSGMGVVYVGNLTDKSDARAPSNPPDIGRPAQVVAPTAELLAYSTSVGPNGGLDYDPHYLEEPV